MGNELVMILMMDMAIADCTNGNSPWYLLPAALPAALPALL